MYCKCIVMGRSCFFNEEIENEINFRMNNLNSLPSQCFFQEKLISQTVVYTDSRKHEPAGYIGNALSS